MAIRSYSALGMLLPPIIIMAHDYSHALNTINACWVYHVKSVSKMGLVFRLPFCNIWGCICWTGPFEFRWLKGYIYNPSCYHNQIGSIYLSHCCHIFRGGVSEMVVLPYSVIYYIYISGTLGPCFNYLCSVCWCSGYDICKRSDTLWPAGRVRLFADYTIWLSSLCRLIWRHWTIKMLVRYMLPSVCLRLRLFSQLSFIQYMGQCVFSLPNSPVMIVRMCTLSYYHHRIGSMNH